MGRFIFIKHAGNDHTVHLGRSIFIHSCNFLIKIQWVICNLYKSLKYYEILKIGVINPLKSKLKNLIVKVF